MTDNNTSTLSCSENIFIGWKEKHISKLDDSNEYDNYIIRQERINGLSGINLTYITRYEVLLRHGPPS